MEGDNFHEGPVNTEGITPELFKWVTEKTVFILYNVASLSVDSKTKQCGAVHCKCREPLPLFITFVPT